MTWCFLLVGMLTLGGYCLCCGCSYCSDWTSTSTLQLDVGGITADLDTATCCTSLNGTYILDLDPNAPCKFLKFTEDGQCATDKCDDCICGGAGSTCNGEAGVCNPADSNSCDVSGSVFHNPDCADCLDTEGGGTTLPPGSNPSACDCLCQVTTEVFGVDVDPTPYAWANPGDFVYRCTCSGKSCNGTQSKSGIHLTAEILDNTPGSRLSVSGNMTGGIFAAITTIDAVNPEVVCATKISSLSMSGDLGWTPCGSPFGCLCNAPTTLTATFIP